MYSLSKDLSNRVAGNMVAINPSSWVTNFIPIAQATGECSPQNISKAMYDVVTKNVVNDDFNNRSTFMTNRLGSENLYKTDMQKIVDKLSKGMQLVDNFTSEVVTRAKYYQNIENGMSDTEAMKNADAYAAGLIADRSKGAMPTMFNIKNPVTKAFTQFQLEQNNQLRYLFKDLPRAKKDEATKALLIALFNIAVSSWLFNTGSVSYTHLALQAAALRSYSGSGSKSSASNAGTTMKISDAEKIIKANQENGTLPPQEALDIYSNYYGFSPTLYNEDSVKQAQSYVRQAINQAKQQGLQWDNKQIAEYIKAYQAARGLSDNDAIELMKRLGI